MIDFDELIDSYLKKERKKKEIGRYYPSEIGTCIRKIWYSYKYPQDDDPNLSRIFEMGNIIHDFIAKVFKSEKNNDIELVSEEKPIKEMIDDFIISGRLDDVVYVKSKDSKILIEVKSTGDVYNVKEPYDSHVIQLQYYMKNTGIKDGVLLYVDKKNLRVKSFVVNYDESKSEEILNRFRILNKCLKTNVLPVPEFRLSKKTSMACRFCEYSGRCYSDTPKI